MKDCHVPFHTFKIAPETHEWRLPKKVREKHDNKKRNETNRNPRKLWTIRRLIARKDNPCRKNYFCNYSKSKILSRYKGKKEGVRNNERDKRYRKDTDIHNSFCNVFHDGENYTIAALPL